MAGTVTLLRGQDQRSREVSGHEASLSHLASSLYAVESSLDLAFVRSVAGAGGNAAVLAAEVEAGLARVWTLYPLARDHLQQLAGAATAGRRGEVDQLLRADAVALPGGARTGVGPLIDQLQSQLGDVAERAARLTAGARRSVTVVDAATTTAVSLLDTAKALGAEDDVEIRSALQAVEIARAAVANDPVTADVTDELDLAIEAARQRIALLERQRERLPAELARARGQVEEITRLVKSGADALIEVRSKIARPDGLLEPLDPRRLDDDDRAMRPWLALIERDAAAGRWRAAAAELEQWRKVTHTWLERARSVSTQNRAPLVRRNELRGLLKAYEAKAVASGRAEDPRLISSGQAARDALYVTPCDLATAEVLVRAYVDALNRRTEVSGS